MPVLKIMKDGEWENVSGLSRHTHTIDEITDFPENLQSDIESLRSNIDEIESKVGESSVSDLIADAVSGKADSDHEHDEYAQKTEVASLSALVGTTKVADQISDALDDIIIPVQSVNGKTGAVALTASDVGAMPANTQIPSIAGLATETYVNNAVSGKVDKVNGKGLSTNDYSTEEKGKLAGIEKGANKTVVDSSLSSSSTNPVQNKVVQSAISNLQTLVGNKPVSEQISTAIGELRTAILGGAW